MINKILLFLMACCVIGIILACLATVPSFSSPIVNVTIPHDEIEITFDPYQEEIAPIVNITIPHDEIQIIYLEQ